MKPSVIVRLAGGLGNQLFQYAFGRAMAVRNDARLVLDAVSGFPRDPYRRSFALSPFDIRGDFLPASRGYTSLFGRLRRRLLQAYSSRLPVPRRPYVTETDISHWDPLISELRLTQTTYFDGYWQHEEYFRDIRDTLRQELTTTATLAPRCLRLAQSLPERRSVAVHVRCLRHSTAHSPATPQLDVDPRYYSTAIEFMSTRIDNPVFVAFADDLDWVRRHISFPSGTIFPEGKRSDHEDLWLMSQCRGFIIANSTFSWWGAWLSRHDDKLVIAPRSGLERGIHSVPPDWQLV